jgi:hypothetical protein
MTLFEKVKDALKKGLTPLEVSCIFGVSETICQKILNRLNETKEN